MLNAENTGTPTGAERSLTANTPDMSLIPVYFSIISKNPVTFTETSSIYTVDQVLYHDIRYLIYKDHELQPRDRRVYLQHKLTGRDPQYILYGHSWRAGILRARKLKLQQTGVIPNALEPGVGRFGDAMETEPNINATGASDEEIPATASDGETPATARDEEIPVTTRDEEVPATASDEFAAAASDVEIPATASDEEMLATATGSTDSAIENSPSSNQDPSSSNPTPPKEINVQFPTPANFVLLEIGWAKKPMPDIPRVQNKIPVQSDQPPTGTDPAHSPPRIPPKSPHGPRRPGSPRNRRNPPGSPAHNPPRTRPNSPLKRTANSPPARPEKRANSPTSPEKRSK